MNHDCNVTLDLSEALCVIRDAEKQAKDTNDDRLDDITIIRQKLEELLEIVR